MDNKVNISEPAVFESQSCHSPLGFMLHQLFERQVEITPNNIAIVFKNQSLTYRELNTKANQLARYLRKQGVKPDIFVAICVDRSLEMVIGILGILKAGGTYVPIDPNCPRVRINHILQDSKAHLFLTKKCVSQSRQKDVIYLDDGWSIVSKEAKTNLISHTKSNHLACVIYTSGSTGRPKGVMVKHNSLVNLFLYIKKILRLDVYDSWAFLHSISSDFAAWNMWGALTSGARLLICAGEGITAIQDCVKQLSKELVTILSITPSIFPCFTKILYQNKSLKHLIFAGEKLQRYLLSTSIINNDYVIWNLYGPTETAICSTYYKVEQIDREYESVPIGRPVQNVQVYVLDQSEQIVPVNTIGELYIGGVGVARGYLNLPELTKEKFIPNPFGKGKLYKTGDLVRQLPDGNLEFIGRIDNQVKLRGFRIELEEIEHILLKHAAIIESVVIKQTSEKGDFLIAFITVHGKKKNVDIGNIRNYLKQHLPYYMIPSAFVVLDKMPLTSNFKIDRKALQQYLGKKQVAHTQYIPPQNEIQTVLIGIFSEVLELPSNKIGINDNFFDLGGTSISAAQVAVRVAEYLSVDFDVKYLTDNLTVKQLAEIIETLPTANLPSIYQHAEQMADHKLPLSYAQQGLWFLTELASGNPYYNVALQLKLKGNLDVNALEKTLLTIMRRHEPLRTLFVIGSHQPCQRILAVDSIKLPLVFHDVSHLDSSFIKDQMLQMAQQPFQLDQAPAIRFNLFKTSSRKHILLVCVHHIIIDGWSINLFNQEFVALYQSFTNQENNPLPDISVSYSQYTRWQHQVVTNKQLADQLSYWKKQLDDLPTLQLPTDYPRPHLPAHQGDHVYLILSCDLTDQLKQFAKDQRTTLFTVLSTAYSVLLSKYSGQEDIVFGIPVVGRRHQAVEKLIGFFVNMLALRIDLNNCHSFLELFERVKQISTEAYANQDVPFEKVVSALQPARKRNQNPLFQVTIGLEPPLEYHFSTPDLEIQYEQLDLNYAIFDLALLLDEKDDQLRGRFQYSCDLFKKETIERFAEHFERILEQLVRQPKGLISDISLLTPQEEAILLKTRNSTKTAYPDTKTIHQLFEEQVTKTPDQIAVIFEDQQLTYRELNKKANQLARYLRQQGIKSESFVGAYLDRSLDMVVAILGILKAGNAYVPIDPKMPKARVLHILQETKMLAVITHQSLKSHFFNLKNISVICLDNASLQKQAVDNIGGDHASAHLAYVLYTSGSTGIPRGVCISHQSLVNHMHWMQRNWQLNKEDRVLQKTPFMFDASVWEFYLPLLSGAQLVIAPPNAHRDMQQLAQCIQQHRITIVQFVPSLLRSFLNCCQAKSCHNLKHVFVGGEALDQELVDLFYQTFPNAILYNLYGPTEATIDATMFPCQPQNRTRTASIGHPIDNVQTYVLDKQRKLVPIGIVGELYLGGVALARGYLNQPKLTKEKFIKNPFGEGRLYNTGDLVRWLPDGNLEFVGRVDHQIKLRGFRIELEEIEYALQQHQYVNQTAVLVDNPTRISRLIACIKLSENLIPQLLQKHGSAWSTQQIKHWQSVFQSVYDESKSDEQSAHKYQYNFAGWNSSYTNQPFPLKDMLEWLHHTIKRIEALGPKRVLEIGCGTGLVLFSIAPYCEFYHMTDFSSKALDCIQKGMAYLKLNLPVKMTKRLANEFTQADKKSYDTIIINSVIQYFPNIDYLIKVLEQALDCIGPSGQIFIGDIRSLEHLELFYGIVNLYRTTSNTDYDKWCLNVKQHLSSEEELLLSPQFFYAFAKTHPKITHVEIQLKRGQYQNEMTQFRYDVVLYVGKTPQYINNAEKIDWQKECLSLSEIKTLLKKQEKRAFIIYNISNARLSKYIHLIEQMHQTKHLENIFKNNFLISDGINPEDLWQCMKDSPYEIKITWSLKNPKNCYDAVFIHKDYGEFTTAQQSIDKTKQRARQNYANQPLYAQFKRHLVNTLRHHLETQLPEYMVPQMFIVLDKLPKTMSGKVDRQSLQQLTTNRTVSETTYVAPRNSIERKLCAIWSESLNVQHIGIHDNFFKLGGHSLLAAQLVSRIQAVFNIKCCIGAVFEAQTITALSQLIQEKQKISAVVENVETA